MSEPFPMDELVDRLLLIATLNSTLIHFLLSSQIEGSIDPDRVDSLTQGLKRTRKWMEDATTSEGIPSSTANIMGLIVKRLSQIESLLPKLSVIAKKAEVHGSPTQEILSLLEASTRPAGGLTPLAGTSNVIPLVEGAASVPEEAFRKVEVEDDERGLIGKTQRLIKQYSKRCHVLLPTFWLEVVRDLHKYKSNSPYASEIIEIPSKIAAQIVKTLLTEAPGARLLQDLSKKRPVEIYLDPSETERIERAVSKYFSGLEGVLSGAIPKPADKVSEAQMIFDGFDWGGPDLEKRIIKRFNQRCEETLHDAETATDPAKQVIYAEATKLLCKLQHALLAESRFREILAQIKP